MTFQNRLKRCMRRRNMRVADLARWFDRPYTTVREWVLHGRELSSEKSDLAEAERDHVMRRLKALEKAL